MEERKEGNKTIIEVPKLGTIEVYPTPSGHAVDINGKRAWSAWMGSERLVVLGVRERVRLFLYIQKFKGEET